jgi:hypothetical protein
MKKHNVNPTTAPTTVPTVVPKPIERRKFSYSKFLLLGGVILGAVFIFTGHFQEHDNLVAYIILMVTLTINRMDSRSKGYKLALSGPGGSGLSLESGSSSEAKEDDESE